MRKISTPSGTKLIEVDDRGAIHEFLLERAADIGNASPELPMVFRRGIPQGKRGWTGGQVFIQADYLSGLEYLTLGLTDMAQIMLRQIPARARKKALKQIGEIATQAVHQAIIENKEIFVGLILGEARLGKDYFETFEEFRD